jgi:hypothetical protein
MMYRLFMPFWKDVAPLARVEKYASYARMRWSSEPVTGLPSQYVAARFYFSDCFPETPANREFVRSTIEGISRHMPLVLLNTPFQVDDHRDVDSFSSGRVTVVASRMTPSRNLAVQTGIIAGARAFVGTYGGYSYLAPFHGVTSLGFYSEPTFKAQHLHVAQHIFREIGGPSLVPLNVAAWPTMCLATSGGLVEAS